MRHRNETCGWHVCAGRVTNVADLDLAVARTGPHDGGAVRVADAPGGPEVEEHAPEEITTNYHSCAEALRQNAESAVDFGDARRRFRRQGLARADPRSRPLRPRRKHAPAKKPREKASRGGRGPQMKKC